MLSSFMRRVKGGFLGEGANQLLQGWRSASGGRRRSPPERDRPHPAFRAHSSALVAAALSRRSHYFVASQTCFADLRKELQILHSEAKKQSKWPHICLSWGQSH
jgi:hypothetical protein